jgi:hypothetical protein
MINNPIFHDRFIKSCDFISNNRIISLMNCSNDDLINNPYATAFLGAFFPFVLAGFAYILKKSHERSVKHYNTLIHFEALLNDHIGAIQDNIYLINGIIPTISVGDINWSKLKPIDVDKFSLKDLYNLDLINDLNSYFYTIIRLSDDINGISSAYQELKEALINKNINQDTYILNCKEIIRNLLIIQKFLEKTSDETIILLSKIRIVINRDRTLLMKVIGRIVELFLHKSESSFTEKELKKEKKQLLKEIADFKEESQKNIDQVKVELNEK